MRYVAKQKEEHIPFPWNYHRLAAMACIMGTHERIRDYVMWSCGACNHLRTEPHGFMSWLHASAAKDALDAKMIRIATFGPHIPQTNMPPHSILRSFIKLFIQQKFRTKIGNWVCGVHFCVLSTLRDGVKSEYGYLRAIRRPESEKFLLCLLCIFQHISLRIRGRVYY